MCIDHRVLAAPPEEGFNKAEGAHTHIAHTSWFIGVCVFCVLTHGNLFYQPTCIDFIFGDLSEWIGFKKVFTQQVSGTIASRFRKTSRNNDIRAG